MSSEDTLAEIISAHLRSVDAPMIVGIDGRSGVGKSTLAAQLAERLGAAVVEGDDFYAGGSQQRWDAMTPAERAAYCIDWRRQVPVLTALRAGQQAKWCPYDWDAFDGSLSSVPVLCDPAALVVLEGVYSCRPELHDPVDLKVLVDIPEAQRQQQLHEREGDDYRSGWESLWSSAEDYYFDAVMPAGRFDLVVPERP